MKKLSLTLGALALVAATAIPALSQAQFARSSDAIEYRQAAFFLMGQHFGRIGAVVKGDKPFDASAVKADFAVFETVAALPWHAFGEGTQGGKATDAVWKNGAKFQEAGQNFQTQVAALKVAVESNDLNQLKTAFGNTGASCKACHDDFRKK